MRPPPCAPRRAGAAARPPRLPDQQDLCHLGRAGLAEARGGRGLHQTPRRQGAAGAARCALRTARCASLFESIVQRQSHSMDQRIITASVYSLAMLYSHEQSTPLTTARRAAKPCAAAPAGQAPALRPLPTRPAPRCARSPPASVGAPPSWWRGATWGAASTVPPRTRGCLSSTRRGCSGGRAGELRAGSGPLHCGARGTRALSLFK